MFKDSEILNEAMKVEVDDEKVRGRMLQDISQRNVLSWYLYVIIQIAVLTNKSEIRILETNKSGMVILEANKSRTGMLETHELEQVSWKRKKAKLYWNII